MSFAVKLQFVIDPVKDLTADPDCRGGEPADNHWTVPKAEIDPCSDDLLPLMLDVCKRFNAASVLAGPRQSDTGHEAHLYMRVMDSDGKV